VPACPPAVQFADVVVSVARKTDAAMWPALFAAVGSPAAVVEGLLGAGALQSAACCLLVVDRLEGATPAHALALRLVRVRRRVLVPRAAGSTVVRAQPEPASCGALFRGLGVGLGFRI
jgi:RIC1